MTTQGAIEAVVGDLAGTAAVRRPEAAEAERRRKTKDKVHRRTTREPGGVKSNAGLAL